MKRLISHQILPEINLRDALYLWAQLPWIKSKKQLDFSDFFGTDQYILTNTARSALSLLIQELDLPKDKRIALPAFCCCVMATPFLSAGYRIEWIDTNDRGLMDPEDFEKKSDHVSLVLVPHIFGQKAPLKAIYQIAQTKGIFMIEDCAHRLPTEQCQQPDNASKAFSSSQVPKFSNWHCDARLYSFGREKVVSCVSGGALVINKESTNLRIYESRKLLSYSVTQLPSSLNWTLRHMIHPLVYSLSIPWWFLGGKYLVALFQTLRLLPKAVTHTEKQGAEDVPIERLSFPHQKLLRRQINLLNNKFAHKKGLAKKYKEALKRLKSFPDFVPLTRGTDPASRDRGGLIIPDNYFRVILQLDAATKDNVTKKAATQGIYLREWDGIPISPSSVDLEAFGYTLGLCPNAEHYAQTYLTLPINARIHENDIDKIGQML